MLPKHILIKIEFSFLGSTEFSRTDCSSDPMILSQDSSSFQVGLVFKVLNASIINFRSLTQGYMDRPSSRFKLLLGWQLPKLP